ncbi:LytTR family DNA-binding domain-containing protein [Rapidithrix thailandica]|uniref:LytTR family DNA-binding domain-containing protein n=1 Tax=Rapidithrix thailandica TaxID=413964 RepID=A0AAW9S4Q1_9BACT
MDCIIVDDESVARQIIKTHVLNTPELTLVGEFEDSIEAFNFLKDNKVDVAFLDIEMPEMTGMDLVQSIPDLPQIILITAQKEYALEAFEYNVVDFLVKPVRYPRFMKALDKVKQNLQKTSEKAPEDQIYVKADNKIVRLTLEDIFFIEALSDYVIINTLQKKYVVHSTMKGMEKRLAATNFIRVHRSYIVNINKIDTIEDMTIVMPQKEIPIGASYKSSFMEKLNFL